MSARTKQLFAIYLVLLSQSNTLEDMGHNIRVGVSQSKCLLKDTVNILARKVGLRLHFAVVEIIFIAPSPLLSPPKPPRNLPSSPSNL